MKKVICAITSVLLIILLLTGCMQIRIGIDIKNDGKVDLKLFVAISESLSSMAGESADSIFDNVDSFIGTSDEYKVQPYEENGYKGYIISREDMTLEDMSETQMSITKQGAKYILDWKLDFGETFGSYASSMKAMGGFAEVVVTLPNRSITNNATSVSKDGKTLTWDLTEFKEESIHVEYRIVSPLMRVLNIVIVIVLALIVVLLIFFVAKAIKKHNQNKVFADKDEAEKLRTYKKLLDEGILTQEEFDAKKAEVLNLNKQPEEAVESSPEETETESAEPENTETTEDTTEEKVEETDGEETEKTE